MNWIHDYSVGSDWLLYVLCVWDFLVLIAVYEFLFEKFQNKLIPYAIAMVADIVVSQTILHSLFPERYSAVSSLVFPYIAGQLIAVGFSAFFLTWLGECYVFRDDYMSVRQTELRRRIAEGLNAFTPRAELFDALKKDFHDLNERLIARFLAKSIDDEDKKRNRRINTCLVLLLLCSCVYNFYMVLYVNRFPWYSLQLDFYILVSFAIPFALLALSLIKLKLAIDMIQYKPYTYVVLALLCAAGIIVVLLKAIATRHFPIESYVSLGGNVIAIWFSVEIKRYLFPHYRLFSVKKTGEGEYAL